jgi:hypothetical protein
MCLDLYPSSNIVTRCHRSYQHNGLGRNHENATRQSEHGSKSLYSYGCGVGQSRLLVNLGFPVFKRIYICTVCCI